MVEVRPRRKVKIYLDTSVPSAYDDERKPERQAETIAFWETLDAYDVLISVLMIDELREMERRDAEKARKLLELIQPFQPVAISEEAMQLTDAYRRWRVVRRGAREDALHLAMATVLGVQYLVSWNYADLVNERTRTRVEAVNRLLGYPPIRIVSPPELRGGR